MTESGRIREFEELLARYNRAFYERDLAALRALYVPDVEVPYFDNHADCDAVWPPLMRVVMFRRRSCDE